MEGEMLVGAVVVVCVLVAGVMVGGVVVVTVLVASLVPGWRDGGFVVGLVYE